MKKRPSARHLGAFFGIGLVMLSVHALAAAPLCAGVFSSIATMSQKEIDAKINELASLKLDLDLALSNGGSQRLGEKAVRAKFSEILEKTVSDLQGLKSEAEIRTMIFDRIAEMQNRKSADKKVEAEAREQHQVVVPRFHRNYKIKESVKLDVSSIPQNRLFEIVPSLDIVVMETPGKKVFDLSIFDLNTKKLTSPLKDIVAAVTHKRSRTAYALQPNGQIISYDLKNKKRTVVMDTQVKGPQEFEVGTTQPKIDVDLTGRFLLLKMRDHTYLVDLSTRTIEEFAKSLKFAKFVNDTVVASPMSDGYIYRYPIVDGKIKKVEYFDEYVDGIVDVFPTIEQTHVVLWAFKSVHASPETSYGDLFKQSFRFDDLEPSAMVHKVKGVADGNAFYVKHNDEMSDFHDIYIYDPVEGFTVATTLAPIQQSRGIQQITVSESGDRVITIHEQTTDNPTETYLDIWSD